MATTAEQLASVQALISLIESSNQSAADQDGRTYTRANLATLYDREERLLERQSAEAIGGGNMLMGLGYQPR